MELVIHLPLSPYKNILRNCLNGSLSNSEALKKHRQLLRMPLCGRKAYNVKHNILTRNNGAINLHLLCYRRFRMCYNQGLSRSILVSCSSHSLLLLLLLLFTDSLIGWIPEDSLICWLLILSVFGLPTIFLSTFILFASNICLVFIVCFHSCLPCGGHNREYNSFIFFFFVYLFFSDKIIQLELFIFIT